MSAYLTRAQEKKLLDTYKLHNMKRFHSMNAATYTDEYSVEFYSYYTHCVSWYPTCRVLQVFPIVTDKFNYAISPTTTRQLNRFLHERVSPRLSIAVLQYGFELINNMLDVSEPNRYYEIDNIDVRYVKHSHTLEKCL